MKKALLVLLGLSVGAIAFAYSVGAFKLSIGANAGSCAMDGEINPQLRASIDRAALDFTNEMLSAKPEEAYPTMTKDAQTHVSLEQFGAGMPALRTMGPFDNVHLSHTYLLHSAGGGPETRTVCGTLADFKWVAVAIKPGQTQAHVEISAKTRNNDWDFTLWLLSEAGQWRVQYFNLSMSTIVGQTPEILIAKAREERDAGRMFNAAMLYAGAQTVAGRGPAFQLGVTQELQEDLAKFDAPAELKGTPPFTWKLEAHTYRIAQVGIIGIAGKLGLMFSLPTTEWPSQQAIDASNRAFITDFRATHPEYSRVFGFLVASATKPDNSGGFRTVYEEGKGFD